MGMCLSRLKAIQPSFAHAQDRSLRSRPAERCSSSRTQVTSHPSHQSNSIHTLWVRIELERVMGIEPTSKAWEALVLPLNYTRND